MVQSPEGQTQEDGLITRRNEGQGLLSEVHREQKSMCSASFSHYGAGWIIGYTQKAG